MEPGSVETGPVETGPDLIKQAPAAKWRGRDFAFVMIAGLTVGTAASLVPSALGWNDDSLLVTITLGQYLGHIIGLVMLGRRRGGITSLGFSIQPSDLRYVGLGVLLQIFLPLLFYPLSNLVGEGDAGQAVSDQIRQLGGTGTKTAMVLAVGVLAPVIEELMFRGILLKALAGAGRRVAIIVSASVFAGFHLFGISGDFLTGVVLTMPTFIAVGVILARLTLRRDRLGPAIFTHSGFNLLGLLVLLMPPELFDQIANSQ